MCADDSGADDLQNTHAPSPDKMSEPGSRRKNEKLIRPRGEVFTTPLEFSVPLSSAGSWWNRSGPPRGDFALPPAAVLKGLAERSATEVSRAASKACKTSTELFRGCGFASSVFADTLRG